MTQDFKDKMKKRFPHHCPCHLCKRYAGKLDLFDLQTFLCLFVFYLLLVCVCVCACVCVCLFFHRKGFFRLQRFYGHNWGYRSTILCCEYYAGCFCQDPSSPYLKMSYFTFKDENPASANWKENYMIYWKTLKRWYILI